MNQMIPSLFNDCLGLKHLKKKVAKNPKAIAITADIIRQAN